MKLLPALLGSLVLACSACLTSCSGGGGAEVTVSQTVNQNQNNNSQNGDTKCTFECEPVELAGQAGFAVSQVCEGAVVNGPNFLQTAPVGCKFLPGVEGASFEDSTVEEVVEQTNSGGIQQQV